MTEKLKCFPKFVKTSSIVGFIIWSTTMKRIFIVTDHLWTNAHQWVLRSIKKVHNFKCIFHSFGLGKKLILKNRKIIKEPFNFIYLRGIVLWCWGISHILYICSLSTIIISHITELFPCSIHLTYIHLYSWGEG